MRNKNDLNKIIYINKMFCKKLGCINILSNNNLEINNVDDYNNYIISSKCTCNYCVFIDLYIDKIKGEIDVDNKNKSMSISNYHNNYNYPNFLLKLKNNLLKNDLYARKIFFI